MTVTFDPFDPTFQADPYPQWTALREQDPVHETPFGLWLLSRYDDVARFVRDPALSAEEGRARPNPVFDAVRALAGIDPTVERPGSKAMLNRDAPDHTRLRRLVSKAFTPKRIEELRPRVQQLVDDALDALAASGGGDLIAGLAFPLPFLVISEMLGMPDTDRIQLREWSGTLVRSLEPIADPEVLKAVAAANLNMRSLISDVIEWKRKEPGADLLTALIQAEENGDVLGDDELVEQVILLYVAGHETTVNLIGNGTLALLRHPDQLKRLSDDPSLITTAVEEFLRFDPPVQMTRRITLSDVEVGGRTIPEGSFVGLIIAAANRDPRHFGDSADALDVARADANQHLAFGGGIHHCLGAALARIEGQCALGSLVSRFPHVQPDGEPEWNGRINLRGMDRLPVAL
jgi:cytochrome P450